MGFAKRIGSALLRWIKRTLGLHPIRDITISAGVLDDISDMAGSAHPKEMLAFMSSTRGNRHGIVYIDEIQLQAYVASEDSATFHTWNMPTVTGIVGTVHSHPGGSKRPSDADLHLFSKFGYIHAIIGEPYRPRDIRFYNKDGIAIAVRVVDD
jgi:proteasome lid subunit RPN8/RPN11